MKTRILIEIQYGIIANIGQTGSDDPIDIIFVEYNRQGDAEVTKGELDWKSPTAAEMYVDEPEIQEQIRKIEDDSK